MASITLTAAEQKMLAAVVSLMGDVPNVDYNIVAQAVGQKYARNARSGCKRLFDKLRAASGGASTAADSDAGAGPSATTEKGASNKVVKKPAASKSGRKKLLKKEVKEESEDEDAEEVDMGENGDEDGKSNPPMFSADQQTQDLKAQSEFDNAFSSQTCVADFDMVGLDEYEAQHPYPSSPGGGLASFGDATNHLKGFFEWKKTLS